MWASVTVTLPFAFTRRRGVPVLGWLCAKGPLLGVLASCTCPCGRGVVHHQRPWLVQPPALPGALPRLAVGWRVLGPLLSAPTGALTRGRCGGGGAPPWRVGDGVSRGTPAPSAPAPSASTSSCLGRWGDHGTTGLGHRRRRQPREQRRLVGEDNQGHRVLGLLATLPEQDDGGQGPVVSAPPP